MQAVTNIFDQLRLSPPIPGPLHKRTVDAADLGTTAEVLAAAKALYRLIEGRRGRQILGFEQLPKRDQNRYINEVFQSLQRCAKGNEVRFPTKILNHFCRGCGTLLSADERQTGLCSSCSESHAFFQEQKTSHVHRPKICRATRPNEAKHVPDSPDEGLI